LKSLDSQCQESCGRSSSELTPLKKQSPHEGSHDMIKLGKRWRDGGSSGKRTFLQISPLVISIMALFSIGYVHFVVFSVSWNKASTIHIDKIFLAKTQAEERKHFSLEITSQHKPRSFTPHSKVQSRSNSSHQYCMGFSL
jgi:hypothetical protein